MKLHELKIEHKYLVEVAAGRKTFELRKNDRDYQEGDLIRFIELPEKNNKIPVVFGAAPQKISTLNSDDLYKITYVLKDVPQYGLDADYCILGIKRLEIKEV